MLSLKDKRKNYKSLLIKFLHKTKNKRKEKKNKVRRYFLLK